MESLELEFGIKKWVKRVKQACEGGRSSITIVGLGVRPVTVRDTDDLPRGVTPVALVDHF